MSPYKKFKNYVPPMETDNLMHRDLTPEERIKLVLLLECNANRNPFMKEYFQNRNLAILYPIILVTLFMASVKISTGVFSFVLLFFSGIISIQINFIFQHIYAHALMLYYDRWAPNVHSMQDIPIVLFYAFYHHHHSKDDNWAPHLSYYNATGARDVAVSHWNSFFISSTEFPFGRILPKIFLPIMIYYSPRYVIYLLGYELGAFLLPISHDWVHLRSSPQYGVYYVLKSLEVIGIFATKDDHKSHHKYDHRTVYQGFTSSGLYSKVFDDYVNKLWDSIYDYSMKSRTPMYVPTMELAMRIFVVTNVGSFLLSMLV